MKETFNIKQHFKLEEFLSATLYVSAKMKIIRGIFLFGIMISLLKAILDISLSTGSKSVFFVVLNILFLPIFLFLFFGIGIIILSIIVYKLKPGLFKEISYRFNHWGMEKFGIEINLSVPWSHISKYYESRNFFCLFVDNNHSHIVQKRMFDSTADLDDFRNFITWKIHNK